MSDVTNVSKIPFRPRGLAASQGRPQAEFDRQLMFFLDNSVVRISHIEDGETFYAFTNDAKARLEAIAALANMTPAGKA